MNNTTYLGLSMQKALRFVTILSLSLSPIISTCSDYGVLTEYNNNRVTKVEDFAVFSQHELGKISLYHNDSDKSFIVEKENKLQEVKKIFIDKTLLKMTTEQLKAFQQVGRIHVKEMNDGELKLIMKTLGDGGGPICASAAYWAVKTGLWTAFGVAMAAPIAIVAAPAVTALGGGAATAIAVESAIGTVISGGASATIGGALSTVATASATTFATTGFTAWASATVLAMKETVMAAIMSGVCLPAAIEAASLATYAAVLPLPTF